MRTSICCLWGVGFLFIYLRNHHMDTILVVCMQSASRWATARVRPISLALAVTPSVIFLRQLSAVKFRQQDRKSQCLDTAKQGTVSLTSAKSTARASKASRGANPRFVGHRTAIRVRLLASSNHLANATTRQRSRTVGKTLRTVQFVGEIVKKVRLKKVRQ